jgi:hypothetical protein
MNRENTAITVSIIALILSAVSLWHSCDAQRHTRIVSFEQRKQEIRQIMHETRTLVAEMYEEVRNATIEEKDPERRKLHADNLTDITLIRDEFDSVLKHFEREPSTASTQDRLDLEQLATSAIRNNRNAQTLLKRLRANRPK